MKIGRARFFQQMRLWLYSVLLVGVALRLGGGAATFADFVAFCLIGALFYLELCPVCGRLCWWEVSALQKWPNALWIGSDCRRRSVDDGTNPEA